MNEESHLKTVRMLSLFERLSQGEVVNKKKEAERFNINEKTIQRDIEDLRTYFAEYKYDFLFEGIVYKRKDKGYSLKQGDDIWLTNKEILVLSKILLESRAFPKNELQGI